MLRINLIEAFNKIIGLVITALLARTLADKFGAYLYYQTIFTYLFTIALYSSDYNFLINYKKDKQYFSTNQYYHVLLIKFVLLSICSIGLIIYIIRHNLPFTLFPYIIALCTSLFAYDGILYVEDKKKEIILLRLLSQLLSLGILLLFYFKFIDVYFITVVQAVQSVTLTFGTLYFAQKHASFFSPAKLKEAFRSFSPVALRTTSFYFLLRNFIFYFSSIELLILSFSKLNFQRDTFAEGLRLSGILLPFALLYINFNIGKIKEGFYTIVTLLALVIIFLSPVYVYIFFGDGFSDKIYIYNYFVFVFVFNVFIEKDYMDALIREATNKKTIFSFNAVYFIMSAILFLVFCNYTSDMLSLTLFFLLKLLIYYLILQYVIGAKIKKGGIAFAFASIAGINILLNATGYYQEALKLIKNFHQAIL